MDFLKLIKLNIREQFMSLGHKERLVSMENMENVSKDSHELTANIDPENPLVIKVRTSNEIDVHSKETNVSKPLVLARKTQVQEETSMIEEKTETVQEQEIVQTTDPEPEPQPEPQIEEEIPEPTPLPEQPEPEIEIETVLRTATKEPELIWGMTPTVFMIVLSLIMTLLIMIPVILANFEII